MNSANAHRAPWILLVDDDPDIRTALSEVLEDEGFVVRLAGNGQEALELVEALPPALILLDLMMPVMNGWEFCRQLRSQPAWASIPVIVLSAHGKVASTAREFGAVGFVSKPFHLDDLLTLVHRAMSPGLNSRFTSSTY